jgi:3-hydroxyacyl-[acyl-carrier-protein] dehydratase
MDKSAIPGDEPDTVHSSATRDTFPIHQMLPHRFPFLLVDRIIEVQPGKRAVGMRAVTANEFAGGGSPNVLLLEMMAQVGAVAILPTASDDPRPGDGGARGYPYLTRIDAARFLVIPEPGDIVTATVSLLRTRRGMGQAQGCVLIGDRVACEATFSYVLTDS